jgi:gliding motility-associated transport system ATP-binding protein
VIIINKGKVVATDSVKNLQSRARGVESVLVEIDARTGELDAKKVQERLKRVSGASRVTFKEKRPHGSTFEVENSKGGLVRGDLARAVVEAGWDLNELRPASVSLEEIFLQLTREQSDQEAKPKPAKGAAQ